MTVTSVRHLSLCTMCPVGARWVGEQMVIHVLLVETNDRLVLVDTGMGLDDVRSPRSRLGLGFLALTRPRLREEETAASQVERLGFARTDVRDIVVTHLDLDHSGGIPDFPEAAVHVHREERDAALAPATLHERLRYRKVHFSHGPRWAVHEAGGESWFGFASVQVVADDVLLIPLPGHSRGHSVIAVRAPASDREADWYLHAGDAYFYFGELVDPRSCPPGLRAFQRAVAFDDAVRRSNAARLRELHAAEGARVRIFSAHCPTELEQARNRAAGG